MVCWLIAGFICAIFGYGCLYYVVLGWVVGFAVWMLVSVGVRVVVACSYLCCSCCCLLTYCVLCLWLLFCVWVCILAGAWVVLVGLA